MDLKNIGDKEQELREYFVNRVSELKDIRFVGSKNKERRLGVIFS